MHIEFEAIGTRWQIDIPELSGASLEQEIRNRIEQYDKVFSRFRTDSLVWSMHKRPGIYSLPVEAKSLFDFYKDLYDLTQGLFTPLIGNTLSDAGYDKEYSLKTKQMVSPPFWDVALSYNFPSLTTYTQVLLDVGAAGKGHLIDLIGILLENKGITSYCIDAGGDIKNKGNSLLRIGLEHPDHIKQVVGVVSLSNGSICGSSGNRRKWGNYHHIMNPKTLKSVRSVSATWVIADSTIVADGLSTCLFFVKPEVLLSKYNFDYMILYPDNSIDVSKNFSNELFISNV